MEKLALFGDKKNLLNYLNPLKNFNDFNMLELISPEQDDSWSAGIIEYPHTQIKSILKKYSTFPFIIIYNSLSLSVGQQNELIQLCQKNPEIKGLLDYRCNLELYLPLLRQFLFEVNNKQALSEVLSRSLLELERIKEIHKKIVPIRSISKNGISFYSKFTSGEHPGGEFFDFQNQGLENLVFYFNTDSYAISNALLTSYEQFNFKSFNTEELTSFLAKINPAGNAVEVLLMTINRKNLEVQGYNFSSCSIFINGEIRVSTNSLKNIPPEKLSKYHFSFQIGRGERFYLLSSGYLRNMKKYYPQTDMIKQLQYVHKLPAPEALNELFFQLKRKLKEKFPFWDSSIIIVEVDENVLFQI